ncbi:SPOR domain-containing protein [Agarilytica rhodophyticola]|uniref:SPOR domain-containing protein n=1 Tax=Agarilytica rhodophyticola TaxID=1737490 RepID=UPI000B3455BE|nr:SPOR domain-containing protein [Agarilytica rhodophyticola]
MRWIFFSLSFLNLLAFAWGMLVTPSSSRQPATSSSTPNPYASFPELILLSELNSDSKGASSRLPKASSLSVLSNKARRAEQNSGKPFCELVGPFKSTEEANNFVERLNAIEISSSVRDIELPAGPGYWVYLEPQSSRQEALRLLGELQAKRIDSYVIPKGELANGISLGMFSKKSSSDVRIKQIRALGLEPKIDEIERSYHETWVMLAPGEGAKMSSLSWERAMEGINMLERRQNYCLDVASQ